MSIIIIIITQKGSNRRRTNSSKFGAHMDNHHHRHNQGRNVHEVVGRLEYKRVGNLNGARIAFRLDARAIIDVLVADEGA